MQDDDGAAPRTAIFQFQALLRPVVPGGGNAFFVLLCRRRE